MMTHVPAPLKNKQSQVYSNGSTEFYTDIVMPLERLPVHRTAVLGHLGGCLRTSACSLALPIVSLTYNESSVQDALAALTLRSTPESCNTFGEVSQ